MTVHKDSKVLPFSPKNLYDIVADVECAYPEFLPRISEVKVNHGEIIKENMMFWRQHSIDKIQFSKRKLQLKVELDPERMVITASHIDGPFTRTIQQMEF